MILTLLLLFDNVYNNNRNNITTWEWLCRAVKVDDQTERQIPSNRYREHKDKVHVPNKSSSIEYIVSCRKMEIIGVGEKGFYLFFI